MRGFGLVFAGLARLAALVAGAGALCAALTLCWYAARRPLGRRRGGAG